MRDIDNEIDTRSEATGLPAQLLRAVYLREMRSQRSAGAAAQDAALCRVDEFILYALVRDTHCARDRDLIEFVPTA